ncbi:hypothetical protein [Demequina flava]|uniref:hypothetical protein n=1 Tax=Demequina flava TaxID=1095025 RepID=UPI00078484AB|nr:hypothetical protein [Demequina flava]
MFGINGGELLVLILIAIVVIGPERMPEYAQQLRQWIVRGRDMVNEGKDQIKSEVGDDVDWTQYDPRQYDPRRIVREALSEPSPAPSAASAKAAGATTVTTASAGLSDTGRQRESGTLAAGSPSPFDDEAT